MGSDGGPVEPPPRHCRGAAGGPARLAGLGVQHRQDYARPPGREGVRQGAAGGKRLRIFPAHPPRRGRLALDRRSGRPHAGRFGDAFNSPARRAPRPVGGRHPRTAPDAGRLRFVRGQGAFMTAGPFDRLESLAAAWGYWMLHMSWQVAVVVGVLTVLTWLCRRRSAVLL